MTQEDTARDQADKAAVEAAAIGGRTSSDRDEPEDDAQQPLAEAGQGESEGFEEAERELIEHASHGDQHAARRVIDDAPELDDDPRSAEGGEGDRERSSEREQDA